MFVAHNPHRIWVAAGGKNRFGMMTRDRSTRTIGCLRKEPGLEPWDAPDPKAERWKTYDLSHYCNRGSVTTVTMLSLFYMEAGCEQVGAATDCGDRAAVPSISSALLGSSPDNRPHESSLQPGMRLASVTTIHFPPTNSQARRWDRNEYG